MKSFSATDLANKTGDVLAAAATSGEVDIQRFGKSRFVIMSRERYEVLKSGRNPQRSHRVADLTEAEAADLLAALDQELADE